MILMQIFDFSGKKPGFSLVEITVVIVLIGLLATVGLVSYRGIQQRSIKTTLQNDLTNAAKLMENAKGTTLMYPGFLPNDLKTSKGVGMTLVGIESMYTGLSPVQSGVLLETICDELIVEGRGNGRSVGGQVGQYITACNVYGNGGIQINGWHARTFSTPIGQNTIRDWYAANVSYDAWWSDKQTVLQNFATELSNRYLAMGGAFPVTSFWDNWSSGVQKEELPPPSTIYDPSTYCIETTHVSYPDMIWHISAENVKPTEGACP